MNYTIIKDEDDEIYEIRIPFWVKSCIVLTTIATVGTSISFAILVVKSEPKINELSSVFQEFDMSEIHQLIQKAISVLNYVCNNSVIDCN